MIFFAKILKKFFSQYFRMNYSIHQNCKSKHLIQKKNRLLNAKNNPLELKKNVKPINISIDDMDKIVKKEIMKKKTFAKKRLL